ncbi:MAG: hypothetical protein ABSH36_12205, partial [Solirubrobacteraceae bacterium]
MSAIDTSTLRPATVGRPTEPADGPLATADTARAASEVAGADRLPIQTGPRIAGLAVSDGDSVLTQDQVLDRLGLRGDQFAGGIFSRCGVERRHLELDDDFLDRDLQGRAAEVESRLLRHSIRAVDALGIDPATIGTVLSSSLYSLGLPTIAHRLVDHYEMEPTTDKYHVTGVACASAVPLMRMAAGTLHQHPGRDCLVVGAESMSSILTRATADDPRAKTVGASIFGDGCAAAVLSADPGADGPMILATQVHQIGGTLDAVCLALSEQDAYLHLVRELPDLAGAGLPGVAEKFLRRHGVKHAEIDHWMVHPGGRRIIENIQSALQLSDEQTATSWDALANHGNVGTPSIFYV